MKTKHFLIIIGIILFIVCIVFLLLHFFILLIKILIYSFLAGVIYLAYEIHEHSKKVKE